MKMFSKEQFLNSMEHETHVCKHLYNKNALTYLDFRPSENQRSLLELLQHLSRCAKTPVRAIVKDDWSLVKEAGEESKKMKAEDFCLAMDEQLETVKSLLNEVTEDELVNQDRALPSGATQKMGEALVNWPLKFMTAYRMQLFLYLKQAGEQQLNTANCWMGVDKS